MVGSLLNRPVDAKLPTMIEAADAIVLDAAERERGAAMHAKLVEDSDATRAVAERNEPLAEQGDA